MAQDMKNKNTKELALLIFKLIKNFLFELLEPKISFYAASMSWATLFFIIPLFVIILSVTIHTPIFSQYYEKIHQFLASALVPTSTDKVMMWIDSFVANASTMGYIGTAYITIAAILFFRDYDYIVNDIFNDNRRSFFQAIRVYFILLISIPIILSASIWGLIAIGSKLHIAQYLLQFILIWIILIVVYKVSPKEKIPLKSVLISSFVATLIWYIAKTLFIFYILYNKTYTTIYGTISVLLFTFLWIYISWMIFLHGLQLCKILMDED